MTENRSKNKISALLGKIKFEIPVFFLMFVAAVLRSKEYDASVQLWLYISLLAAAAVMAAFAAKYIGMLLRDEGKDSAFFFAALMLTSPFLFSLLFDRSLFEKAEAIVFLLFWASAALLKSRAAVLVPILCAAASFIEPCFALLLFPSLCAMLLSDVTVLKRTARLLVTAASSVLSVLCVVLRRSFEGVGRADDFLNIGFFARLCGLLFLLVLALAPTASIYASFLSERGSGEKKKSFSIPANCLWTPFTALICFFMNESALLCVCALVNSFAVMFFFFFFDKGALRGSGVRSTADFWRRRRPLYYIAVVAGAFYTLYSAFNAESVFDLIEDKIFLF